MAIGQVNYFCSNLPELNILIFSQLPFKEALRARLVCSLFRDIFNQRLHLENQALKFRLVIPIAKPLNMDFFCGNLCFITISDTDSVEKALSRDLANTMTRACTKNYLGYLKWLLGVVDFSRISAFVCDGILFTTVDGKYIESAQLLVDEPKFLARVSDRDLGLCFQLSCNRGFLGVAKSLLNFSETANRPMADTCYNGVLIAGAGGGHTECIRWLLSSPKRVAKIQGYELSSSLLYAVERNRRDCVKLILSYAQSATRRLDVLGDGGEGIERDPWSKILSVMAERGDEEFLGVILDSRWLSSQIPPDKLGQMLLTMAEKGHVNCLKLLLNSRVAAQFPAEAREKAAQAAALLGYAECANLLIQSVLNCQG